MPTTATETIPADLTFTFVANDNSLHLVRVSFLPLLPGLVLDTYTSRRDVVTPELQAALPRCRTTVTCDSESPAVYRSSAALGQQLRVALVLAGVRKG